MKDFFTHFGIKRRYFPENNYNAIWYNLKTIRLGKGVATELPPEYSEFYDVGISTKCTTGNCPFCYVSANSKGVYFQDICETWKNWMDMYNEDEVGGIIYTNKPYQVAIGSTGEALEHPNFCEFVETVYNTNVVPNYTTNGVILAHWNEPDSDYYELANKILDYTNNYVAGVAVSVGNPILKGCAFGAINGLLKKGNCYVNIHHIISDKQSVDNFIGIWKAYKDDIKYHVLLPLMPFGRSKEGIQEGVFEYLENKIQEYDIKNIAFGAHFIKYLKNSKIKTWLYEPESFSKNVLINKNKVVITPSSFDLNPIKTIIL